VNKKNEKGVITLEASIVVPIFVFIVLFFYGFFMFFSGEMTMSHALIQSAESLSLDPYATERLGENTVESGGDLVTAIYSSLTTDENSYFSSSEKWYSGENQNLLLDTVKKRYIGYLSGGDDNNSQATEAKADKFLKDIGVQNGLSGLDFSETKIEGNVLTITIKYKQEFIFDFQGLAAFDRQQTISITLWDVAKE
jgi:hypothetical protein